MYDISGPNPKRNAFEQSTELYFSTGNVVTFKDSMVYYCNRYVYRTAFIVFIITNKCAIYITKLYVTTALPCMIIRYNYIQY